MASLEDDVFFVAERSTRYKGNTIMKLASYTFNDFYENAYILYDETGSCVIIDPGCNSFEEEARLSHFIEFNGLKPERLLNTHCHIDHVLGNLFISNRYDLPLEIHSGEQAVLDFVPQMSSMYGIPFKGNPTNIKYIDPATEIRFGNTRLKVLFTPGHSPASVSFYHEESKTLIAGDVLFEGSIGRTDLPGGDFGTLINSIKTQYYPLGDDVQVYPGHGPATSIGQERLMNPFLSE